MLTKLDFGDLVLWIVISSLSGVVNTCPPAPGIVSSNALSYWKSLDLYLSAPQFSQAWGDQVNSSAAQVSVLSFLHFPFSYGCRHFRQTNTGPYNCFCSNSREAHEDNLPRIICQRSLQTGQQPMAIWCSHFLFIALSPMARAGPYITNHTTTLHRCESVLLCIFLQVGNCGGPKRPKVRDLEFVSHSFKVIVLLPLQSSQVVVNWSSASSRLLSTGVAICWTSCSWNREVVCSHPN